MSKSRGPYKKKFNSNNKADSDWMPSWKWKLNGKDADSLSSVDKDYAYRQISPESGNESDKEKENVCPVCHKSFSRSAALICHVKQNHNYMLNKSKGIETTVHSMKKDVMHWKNQHERKTISTSKETSYGTSVSGSERESGSESCTKSLEDTDQEKSNEFLIIGGSANSNNSTLSFLADTVNAELLDPDQSFSVVRKNSRKRTKVNKENNDKKSKIKLPLPASGFEAIDISIDNSPEELKTLECFVCHNKFSNSRLLTYHHMRNHMDDDFRQCSKCGSVFYDHKMFMRHCSLHES